MTCIVGCLDKRNKKVIIGGDSAGIADYDIMSRKDVKVFKNGKFLIGCTSSFRMIQLLRFSFKPPPIKKKDVYEYMCTDFVDKIRKCFKKGGYIQKYELGDEKGGEFLVGYKDRLFCILDDFQVGENHLGIDSVGCGSPYALGAMHSLIDTNMKPGLKVEKALQAATELSAGVCEPFVIIST